MTRILIASDRFFSLPAPWIAAIWAGAAAVVFLLVKRSGRGRSATAALAIVALLSAGAFGYYKVFRRVMGTLGRHLPDVTLLEPKAGETLGNPVVLAAHATDEPGALGPIGAVRSIEFWLYHPSFAEQHAGNHESKVLLAEVAGPTNDDRYAATWRCQNPYTPARDGDHGGGDGTRAYVLPEDGRPYLVQAHGLDDEWRAKPGHPGFSERVTVNFEPCK